MDLFGWLMTLPIAASLASLCWLAVSGSRRAFTVTLLVSLAGLLMFGFFAWEFRDGILYGPRTSDGLTALQRFWTRFWLPFACWTGFVLVAFGVFSVRRRAG